MQTANRARHNTAKRALMFMALGLGLCLLPACGHKDEAPAASAGAPVAGGAAASGDGAQKPVGSGKRVVDQAKSDANDP